ncbi:unnamed protein product, partial [Owenia fusiformis]
ILKQACQLSRNLRICHALAEEFEVTREKFEVFKIWQDVIKFKPRCSKFGSRCSDLDQGVHILRGGVQHFHVTHVRCSQVDRPAKVKFEILTSVKKNFKLIYSNLQRIFTKQRTFTEIFRWQMRPVSKIGN